ncbi:MAG: glucose-1-phosphate thymidylyltransferase RfbA [Fimbriimonadaceae bacterium]
MDAASIRESGVISKGILLAGGTGSRLWPITRAISKQLLPLYNKPMVYYPLTVLMSAGIRDVLVINTPDEQALFKTLLGDGSQWGMGLTYAVQPKPEGIAQALLIAEGFLASEGCCLILGDNVFYGEGLHEQLRRAATQTSGATVFAYRVAEPRAYGVVAFDENGRAVDIEEKPASPKSNFAVTGLYFYDSLACRIVQTIQPSARGELEITALNQRYLRDGKLRVEVLGRGSAWMDTGTPDDLLGAANFIHAIEARQGLMVGCPEEWALRNGWIDRDRLRVSADQLGKTTYSAYLRALADGASG